jgi:adiponectin receptor
MWGSTIPCVYYGFYCTQRLQTTYYTLVSVLAGGCVYATLHPAFRRPKYRPYRAAMYSGLGLSFMIPIVHGLLKFDWETQMWRMRLDGIDDGIQPYRRRVVRYESESKSLMTTLFSEIRGEG